MNPMVVLGLHHLVTDGEAPAKLLNAGGIGIERRLQAHVERTGAGHAAVHRTQHLDVADRVQPELARNALLDHGEDLVDHVLGLVRGDEVEIAPRFGFPFGHPTLVDAMGVDDDPALCGLAEHFAQAHHGNRGRADDVGQDLPGAHRGELIDVAHQEQRGPRRYGLEQSMQDRHIDHRTLVGDQQVAVEGILLIPGEATAARIHSQQTVNRLRFPLGRLGQALGRPAGRRRSMKCWR